MSVNLSSSVYNWASNLGRHHKIHPHDQPLTQNQFAVLARDKNFSGILGFLVRHIHTPEEQRNIKLNLKHAAFRKHLKGSQKDEEEEEGDGEDRSSEDELRLRAGLLDANLAVNAEVKEIQLINQRIEEGRQRECEARRKAATLALARQEAQTASLNLQRHTQLLDELKEHGRKGKNSPTNVTVQRQLKSNLLDIEKFQQQNRAPTECNQQDNIHTHKIALWQNVGMNLYECGAESMLSCLLGETKGAIRELHSLIQQVDLTRDARELRLKCEKDGTFIDERNPEGVMKGVRELLHLMCAYHVQLYIDAHKANTHAASLTRALNTITNNINAVAKRTYTDENVCKKVIEVIECNIDICGNRTSLDTTMATISQLQHRAEAATSARQAVRAKYEKILTFEKKVQESMNAIHNLATCVSDSWPHICTSLINMRQSISAALTHIETPTYTHAHTLSTEGDAYTAIPLAYLLTYDCDGMGLQQKLNLSTTPLLWHHQSINNEAYGIIYQLRPGMTTWEALYQTICDKLHQSQCLNTQLNRLAFLRGASKSDKGELSTVLSTREMKRLKESVEEHDRKQSSDVTRMVECFEKDLSKGTDLIIAVTRLLKDWWEQPAKNIPVKKLQAI